MKTISQKEFNRLMTLQDSRLDSRLEWLNHTGYAYAQEIAGRLHYVLSVRIARNISESITIRCTVPLNGEYRKVLEIVKL